MGAILCFAAGAFGLFLMFIAVISPDAPPLVYGLAAIFIALAPVGIFLGKLNRCPRCGKWNGWISVMSRKPVDGSPDLEEITRGCTGCDHTVTEIKRKPPDDPGIYW